jgi:hypothetical protein
VAEGANPEPMAQERYDLILREMHEAQLKALQSAHDSALYEVQRLKQRQQSGTQQHLVVSEKRKLSLLIGKTQRARKELIHKMMPHVSYIVDNMGHQNIPINWKTLALEGAPYWSEAVEDESAMIPSISEKNSIVESYLKRQRAWEQVTVILPRETVDAMRFFGDLEKRSIAFMESLPSQPDGQPTSREMNEYHLGCLTVCQDVCVKAREYRLRCRDLWNSIENDLQSDKIVEVTNISGEAGGVPAHLKVNATLPFLPISQQPSVELLSDYIAEHGSLQERNTVD